MSALALLSPDAVYRGKANNTNYVGNKNMKLIRPPKLTTSSLNVSKAISSSIAPTVAKYSGAGYLAFLGLDSLTDMAKEAYIGKMEDAGYDMTSITGKKIEPNQKGVEPTVSEKLDYPVDKKFEESDSVEVEKGEGLLSILKGNGANVANVANSVMKSNLNIAKTIEKQTLQADLSSQVNFALQQSHLENSIATNGLLVVLSDVLQNLTEKIFESTEEANSFKRENAEHNSQILEETKKLTEVIGTKGIAVKKTEIEHSLVAKQLEHITFETTPVQLDNMGDAIPELSPQKMRAVKDAVVAKKNSDENTFELDEDEYDDYFGIPDISSIFGFDKKSERTIEGLN